MDPLTFNQIAILIVVLVAAVIDLRTRKIYNWITFPAAAIGVIANFIQTGWQGGLWAIAGYALGVAIMIFPHPKDKLGFGDAKLMAAIGAFLGPKGLLIVFLYFCVAFGVVAAIRMALVIPWKQLFKFLTMFSRTGVAVAGTFDAAPVIKAMKAKIALGPCIAFGTVVGILFYTQTMLFLGFTP